MLDDGPTILITGAAGNLASLLARHLLPESVPLKLMYHRRPLSQDLRSDARVTPVQADLAWPQTLPPAVRGAAVVVHFAGVLFAPQPEKFLPETNTTWFHNLLRSALEADVRRVILISFPQVEGPTTPDRPATGRLDGQPVSVHARTRLEEEKLLFELTRGTKTTPVSLRLGMVYGRGILMVEAARWLARRRLLAVWKDPTGIHLVSTEDYLRATAAAALRPGVEGIYHIGDERPTTLQHFLDEACRVWGYPKPHRLPLGLIRAAARLCELYARVVGTRSPLTRDFITIGRVPYCGNTARTRAELLPTLAHPTLAAGLETLR